MNATKNVDNLDVLLSAGSVASSFATALETNGDETSALRYARVYMKLGDILSGDFFNDYIKTGDILLLSEGRRGVENVFELRDGVLRLDVDRATFERAGLEGKGVQGGGRKHVKSRYAIELNLRLPSMVHGKKGFERVLWACKNVFDYALTWLFCDLRAPTANQGPLAAHAPTIKTVTPTVETLPGVALPAFPEAIEDNDQDTPAELLEWLIMVALRSPRVQAVDSVDPYLCRYQPPASEPGAPAQSVDLVCYRWHGFVPSAFAQKILLAALKASGEEWMALGGSAFGSDGYWVLKHGKRVMSWKYAD